MKSEGSFRFRVKGAPMVQRRLQHSKRSDDVSLNELGRGIDRAIDMTLCRQMHDRIDPLLGKKAPDRSLVGNVDLLEPVIGMTGDRLQRMEVSRIGELVHVDHAMTTLADEVTADRGAYESGSARDEDPALVHRKGCGGLRPSAARRRRKAA